MNTDPQINLEHLPEPAAPSSIESVVMARIARLEDARRRPQLTGDAPARSWRDLPAWLSSVAGLALFFASWIGGLPSLATLLSSPMTATATLNKMPMNLLTFIGLMIGAVLYVAGLFGADRPIVNDRRSG